MTIKRQLQRSIMELLRHNKDGSHETQAARRHILLQAAGDLTKAGYKFAHIHGIKQKHVIHLNQHWQEHHLTPATIKNRNAHLRWLCEKLNKPNLMPSNDNLGVAKRKYITPENKAIDLNELNLSKITNRHVLVQVHLQRYLGLRREESIKIQPHQADKGNHLQLQSSWCKGGRARNVPIHTPEARYWIEEAKKLTIHPTQSLIPTNKTYIQQRRLYDKQTQQADIKHPHGLRHTYAQERYKELTGWECPKRNGPNKKQFTQLQKEIDAIARLTISADLGHSKSQITKIYCG